MKRPALKSTQKGRRKEMKAQSMIGLLYEFADTYEIEMVQNLALLKLGSTLAAFDLSSTRVRDIVELTEYTSANTMSNEDHTDDLRTLVV